MNKFKIDKWKIGEIALGFVGFLATAFGVVIEMHNAKEADDYKEIIEKEVREQLNSRFENNK